MSEPVPPAEATAPQPKWQPLSRIERRVLGVLVEKAKTTPEAYPLTLNALTNGCNQKSINLCHLFFHFWKECIDGINVVPV